MTIKIGDKITMRDRQQAVITGWNSFGFVEADYPVYYIIPKTAKTGFVMLSDLKSLKKAS